MQKAITLVCIIFSLILFNLSFAEKILSLNEMNFNYQIDPQKGSKPSWYPLSVFSDDEKTYIEFPPGISAKNMPEVYVKPLHDNEGVPQWHWHKSYLIVNQNIKAIKLVKGGSTVTVTNTLKPWQYIKPPPKYIARYVDGFSMLYYAGIGKNGDAAMQSFSTKLALEYNWALSRHWLFGMGLGGYYIPSNGNSAGEHKKLQKAGIDLYAQGTYLFFNGIYLSSMAGIGWSHDEWTNVNTGQKDKKSGFQPELGLKGGYFITPKISVELSTFYMFKAGGLFSNYSILAGIGYHF